MELFGLVNIGVLPILLEALCVPSEFHEQEARYVQQERTIQAVKLPLEDQMSNVKKHEHTKAERRLQRKVRLRQQAKVQLDLLGHHKVHVAVWPRHRAANWNSEHRTWGERGGYSGYQIPQERFRNYFGPGHGFRIFNCALVELGGHPLFQYSGSWISVLDPTPEDWQVDWYDSDTVYIDYTDDGYYLNNRRHPQDRIALEVFKD